MGKPIKKLGHMRKDMFFSGEALDLAIKKSPMGTVLDVGCGNCGHAKEFLLAGHKVTGLDIKPPPIEHPNFTGITGEFNSFEFGTQTFDCLWASHILEHQLDVHSFLKKCFKLLKEGGVLAITVPPMKPSIVGGHVTVWNAGLLLYNLVLAGFDCAEASVKKYGYNISVVVNKKERDGVILKYDRGDILTLAPFFPKELAITENFNGDIQESAWG